MESVASSSNPPDHHRHRRRSRFRLTKPVSDRIARALHHDLRLLHRSDSLFFVLGATANVYTVNLSSIPSCTCPDRITPCKHILFVLIRVLGVSPDDTRLLRRRTLRPCQLNRLLKTCPLLPEAMAGAGLRERFHQLFFRVRNNNGGVIEKGDDAGICPVCLDEMRNDNEGRLVSCGTCKNLIHEDCWVRWKKTRGQRRAASCVLCRARWRDHRTEQERYLNLAAFVSQQQEEDDHDDDQTALCGG